MEFTLISGHVIVGCTSYADGLIVCIMMYGLQKLVNICKLYIAYHSIPFHFQHCCLSPNNIRQIRYNIIILLF